MVIAVPLLACGDNAPERCETFAAARAIGGRWERVALPTCELVQISRDVPFEVAVIRHNGVRPHVALTRWGGGAVAEIAAVCDSPEEPQPISEPFVVPVEAVGAPSARARFAYQWPVDQTDSAPPDPDVGAPSNAVLTSLRPQDVLAVSTDYWYGPATDRYILLHDHDVSEGVMLDFNVDGRPLEWRDIAVTTSDGTPALSRGRVEFVSAGGVTMDIRHGDEARVPTIPKLELRTGDRETLFLGPATVDLSKIADGPIAVSMLPPIDSVDCAWMDAQVSVTATTSASWDSMSLEVISPYPATDPALLLQLTQPAEWPERSLDLHLDLGAIPGWSDAWTAFDPVSCSVGICKDDPGIRRCTSSYLVQYARSM